MKDMFADTTLFDQPLNDWDVSNVTTMYGMFAYASSINQSINQ